MEHKMVSSIIHIDKISIFPELSQWNTPGDNIPILSRRDGSHILYVDKPTGKFMASDTVNTAISKKPYSPNTESDVKLFLSGYRNEMWLSVDNEEGGKVPFCGTLLAGTSVLKFNANEDVLSIRSAYVENTSSHESVIYLAHELAHYL
jgi:hypothetical protein